MRHNAVAEEETQKSRGYHEKCNNGCLKINIVTWLLKSENGAKKSHCKYCRAEKTSICPGNQPSREASGSG